MDRGQVACITTAYDDCLESAQYLYGIMTQTGIDAIDKVFEVTKAKALAHGFAIRIGVFGPSSLHQLLYLYKFEWYENASSDNTVKFIEMDNVY